MWPLKYIAKAMHSNTRDDFWFCEDKHVNERSTRKEKEQSEELSATHNEECFCKALAVNSGSRKSVSKIP